MAIAVVDHTTRGSQIVGGRQCHSLEWAQTLAMLGHDVEVFFNAAATNAVSNIAKRFQIKWRQDNLVRPITTLECARFDAVVSAATWIRLPAGIPVISRWIDPTVMPNAAAYYGHRMIERGHPTPWKAYDNLQGIWMQSETQRTLLTDRYGPAPSSISADVFHAPRDYAVFREASRPWDQRKYDLCFVGRDDWGKRPEFFLCAANRLGLRAVVASPKLGRTNFGNSADVFESADRHTVADILGNSRVFLFAPVCEVCPQTVFEALAAGCIPITNRNGSMPEQVGRHGYLFDNDNIDAACELVSLALQQPNALSTRQERMAHVSQFERQQILVRVSETLQTRIRRRRRVIGSISRDVTPEASKKSTDMTELNNTNSRRRVIGESRFRRPKVVPRRVHIVIDVEGWAYHNAAMALRRYAPSRYTVTIGGRRPSVSDLRGADVVHFLTHNQSHKISAAVRKYCPQAIVIGSLNSGVGRLNGAAQEILNSANAVIHVNWESYEAHGRKERHYQISRGVDLNTFNYRVPISQRNPRVLWTGSHGHRELKGHPILESLRERLANHGLELDLRLVDSHEPIADHREMAEWYNTGAVYVVASESEGTPNPALESAACGCALVATRVGNVPELVADNWNGVIVADRKPETILAGILRAFDERERFVSNMQNVIPHWNWADRAARYFELFDQFLNGTPPSSSWNHRFSATSIRDSLVQQTSHESKESPR